MSRTPKASGVLRGVQLYAGIVLLCVLAGCVAIPSIQSANEPTGAAAAPTACSYPECGTASSVPMESPTAGLPMSSSTPMPTQTEARPLVKTPASKTLAPPSIPATPTPWLIPPAGCGIQELALDEGQATLQNGAVVVPIVARGRALLCTQANRGQVPSAMLDLDTGILTSTERSDLMYVESCGSMCFVTFRPLHGAWLGSGHTIDTGLAGCLDTHDASNRVPQAGEPKGTYYCLLTNEGRAGARSGSNGGLRWADRSVPLRSALSHGG